MVEKLIFSLQIFFLGISVVMVVLFALYGLTSVFNILALRRPKKDKAAPLPETPEPGLPLHLAAAITAALDYHRTADTGAAYALPAEIRIPKTSDSRWLNAARKDLMENSRQLEITRRSRS